MGFCSSLDSLCQWIYLYSFKSSDLTEILFNSFQNVWCKGGIVRSYIISSVMHAFWLVLTYGLLEDRRIDNVIIKTFFNSLLYKTNRFQVAMHLFSNRSQRTSKCGKNISDTLGCALYATFLFLPHLTSSVIYYWTDTWQLGIYLLITCQG